MDLLEIKPILLDGETSQYEISKTGKVRNIKTGKILHTYNNRYDYVCLWKNNFKKNIYIHRLIAMLFIPNPKNYPCVDHIDNNKTNNDISNLRWCSYSQNNMNKKRKITNKSGITGVNFDKKSKKWRARIVMDYHEYFLGRFEKIEDAIIARRKASTELFCEFQNDCEKDI
jgi:hypothetical protein